MFSVVSFHIIPFCCEHARKELIELCFHLKTITSGSFSKTMLCFSFSSSIHRCRVPRSRDNLSATKRTLDIPLNIDKYYTVPGKAQWWLTRAISLVRTSDSSTGLRPSGDSKTSCTMNDMASRAPLSAKY